MTAEKRRPAVPLGLPIAAGSGGSVTQAGMLDGVGDIIIDAIQSVLEILFEPIEEVISQTADAVVDLILTTPHPNAIFGPPTNGVWPELYEYYWESLVPLVLFLYGATIMLIILLQTTSHLFGSYHRTKLIKRSFTGLMGLLSWWWIAGISLRFANSLTVLLAPEVSSITLFETLSFSAMGVLGLVITMSVDLVLFALLALIYLSRQVVLYLFVIAMPILIVFWIPGVGPLTLVSNFAKRMAGFYVPFLFMTLPVALLFRLADILGNSFGISAQGLAAWLLALVIPFVAVLAPIIFIWQAGAIFVFGERAGHHASGRQAQNRVAKANAGAQTTAHGGQNFTRGARGDAAVKRDGQAVLGSGNSRAHAAGTKLRETSVSLRDRITERTGDAASSGGAGDDHDGPSSPPKDGAASSPSRATRQSDFSTLRDRGNDTPSETDETDESTYDPDDRPRYIN